MFNRQSIKINADVLNAKIITDFIYDSKKIVLIAK